MIYQPLFDTPDEIPSILYNAYYFGADEIAKTTNPCGLCLKEKQSEDVGIHFHGSDLGACQKRVYLTKLNKTITDNSMRNPFLIDGLRHEDSIMDYISKVIEQRGYIIYGFQNVKELRLKCEEGFTLVGHPDGFLASYPERIELLKEGYDKNDGFLIECKAVSKEAYKQCQDNYLSDIWYGQIQTYLHLLNLKLGYLIVKNRDNSDILMPFRITYNAEYISNRLNGLQAISQLLKLPNSDIQISKEQTDPKCVECRVCAFHNECWGKK